MDIEKIKVGDVIHDIRDAGALREIEGKGLSTNDYTNADKSKLEGIEANAQKNKIESINVNGSDVTPDSNKAVNLSVPTKMSDLNLDGGDMASGASLRFKNASSSMVIQPFGIVKESNEQSHVISFPDRQGTVALTSDIPDVSGKQDTIQDLSEIRSGAALGATAYQKPSAGIPSSDMSSAVQNSLQLADDADHRPYDSSNPDGMGYLVLKKNKTFAEQVTKDNTIYEVRYQFDITDGTIPSGCVLMFNGGKLTASGTLTLNNTMFSGEISINASSFSGTCKNREVDQRWFSDIEQFISFINTVDGPQVYNFIPGDFNSSVYINKQVDSYLKLNGNGCRITFTPTTDAFAIYIHPKNYESVSAKVASALVPGVHEIVVDDASVFSVGDNISIRDTRKSSWSFYRNYQQGEFSKITAIDTATNTISVSGNIIGNYSSTDSYVYLVKGFIFDADSITVIGEGSTYALMTGIYANGLIGGNIKNVCVENFKNGLLVYKSKGISVEDCTVDCPAIGETGDGYGFRFGNCQNCIVEGGRFIGRNHGISIGGDYTGEMAIVNRNIVISRTESLATKNNYADSSLDCHGNSELIDFINNICSGVDFGGKNIIVQNNDCGNGVINGGELISLNNKIIGNKARLISAILSNSGDTTSNWTPETGAELFDVEGNTITASSTSDKSGTTFGAELNGVYTNISNVEVRFKGNLFKNVFALNGYIGFGTSFSAVKATKTGKFFFDSNNVAVSSQSATLVSDEIRLSKNDVKSAASPMTVSANNLLVDGNIVRMTNQGAWFSLDTPNTVIICDNLVNLGKVSNGNVLIPLLIVRNNTTVSSSNGERIIDFSYSGDTPGKAIIHNNQVYKSLQLTLGKLSKLTYGGNVSVNDGNLVAPTYSSADTVINLDA